MQDPVQIVVGSLDLSGVETVKQTVKIVETTDYDYNGNFNFYRAKLNELRMILTDEWNKQDKIIIFVATKRGCETLKDKINSKLARHRPIAESIHGDKSQSNRENTLRRFKTGQVRVLVATDVAARGIDVNDVAMVINFDFPGNVEEYVHRIGRTGRAGKQGSAVSFFTKDNLSAAKDLIKILEKNQVTVPPKLREYAREAGRKHHSKPKKATISY